MTYVRSDVFRCVYHLITYTVIDRAVFTNHSLLSACDNLHIKNKADGEFIEALQNDLNVADEAKTSLEHEHEKLKAQLEAVQLGNIFSC